MGQVSNTNLVRAEVDRALTLLRNKIRERGFTQLEVQQALSWGRSYISQLLTRQKALRLEQILSILNVIEIEPGEFFAELYQYPRGGSGRWPAVVDAEELESNARKLGELDALVRNLLQVLIDRGLVDRVDLPSTADSIRRSERDPRADRP